MKYAQLIVGLLAGSAIGSSVVASTGSMGRAPAADKEAMKQIVRDVIMEEPQLIITSIEKMQADAQKKQQEASGEAVKDPAIRAQIFDNPNAAAIGPKDSTRMVAEFFDYNCGACKMMFSSIDALQKKDKNVRFVFHEYPIFGPTSEANSKIAIAVNRLYPEKQFDFHTKMMTHEGRTDEKVALGYVKALGMDVDKIKAESEKAEVAAALEANRKLGESLHIQGTPTLVVGDELVPHGLSLEDLEARLK